MALRVNHQAHGSSAAPIWPLTHEGQSMNTDQLESPTTSPATTANGSRAA